MNGWAVAAVASAASSAWVVVPVPSRGLVDDARAGAAAARVSGPAGAPSSRLRRWTAAAAGGATVLLVPGATGWALGIAAAVGLDHWLGGLPDRAAVASADQARRQLPLALELLAAALAAGATTTAAVALAGEGVGLPLGRQLAEVGASLRLGAAAQEAWRPMLDEPSTQQLGRLALRSSASGAAMAAACRDLAAYERQGRAVQAQVAVKRAGVLTVAPLGLCFLPAFVLVGVVPIVVGLLRTLTW